MRSFSPQILPECRFTPGAGVLPRNLTLQIPQFIIDFMAFSAAVLAGHAGRIPRAILFRHGGS